jgi:DNA-binding IclR family transcriptional regulator
MTTSEQLIESAPTFQSRPGLGAQRAPSTFTNHRPPDPALNQPKGDMSVAPEPADMANKSVTKAVLLMRVLAAEPRTGATVTTLAKASGISRPTAFRLLNSLERTGLVDRHDHLYTLGWELARLGRHADPYTGLVAKAQPLLQDLADDLNESVTLAVPNTNDGLDLVAEATGTHVIGITSRHSSQMIGQRYPLHASSSGKVLLAEWSAEKIGAVLPGQLEAYTAETITDRAVLLKELILVREQGYGIIDNELEAELISLSRPVRDSSGTLVAILTLNSPRYRLGRELIPAVLQRMQRTVEQLAGAFWQESTND